MIQKKLVAIILSAVVLVGCSKSKPVEDKIPEESKNIAATQMDKMVEERLGDTQIKAEQEAILKAKQEADAKAEQQAKQKAEAENKAQQASKSVSKPVSKPQTNTEVVQQKPAPKVSAPVQTYPSSLPAIPSKHPVEYMTQIENEILTLVNEERAKVGAKPLTSNQTLKNMARYKSNEMLQYGYFNHNSPYVGGLSSLAKKFRYSYTAVGENIWMSKSSSGDYLRQNTTAVKIVNGWMNSSGHRANILNPDFGRIGIGVVLSTDGFSYATQEFSN